MNKFKPKPFPNIYKCCTIIVQKMLVDALFQIKSLTLSLRHYLSNHTGVNLKDLDQLVDKLVEKLVPNL